ncbi:MAG: prolyl oligopeptidase family serine peptidase, partial [Pirellulales bacterium]|nr:prolyl oligopeptidase family serine peptidase [Pirellulales bacterium]
DPVKPGPLNETLRRLAFTPGEIAGLTAAQIKQRVHSISPARLVTAQTPPFLLIHGGLDLLVPLQQSRLMVSALDRKQVPVKLIVKPGGGHPWPTIAEEVALMARWFDRQLVASRAHPDVP